MAELSITVEIDAPDLRAGIPLTDGSVIYTKIAGLPRVKHILRLPGHDGAALKCNWPPYYLERDGES